MELLNKINKEHQKEASETREFISDAELKKQARLAESAFDITLIAGVEKEDILRGRTMYDDIHTMRRETPWLKKDDVSVGDKPASFRLVSVEGTASNQWGANEGTYSVLEIKVEGEHTGSEISMFGDINAAIETGDGSVLVGQGLTTEEELHSKVQKINGKPVESWDENRISRLHKMVTSDSDAFRETEELLRWMSAEYRKDAKD